MTRRRARRPHTEEGLRARSRRTRAAPTTPREQRSEHRNLIFKTAAPEGTRFSGRLRVYAQHVDAPICTRTTTRPPRPPLFRTTTHPPATTPSIDNSRPTSTGRTSTRRLRTRRRPPQHRPPIRPSPRHVHGRRAPERRLDPPPRTRAGRRPTSTPLNPLLALIGANDASQRRQAPQRLTDLQVAPQPALVVLFASKHPQQL